MLDVLLWIVLRVPRCYDVAFGQLFAAAQTIPSISMLDRIIMAEVLLAAI